MPRKRKAIKLSEYLAAALACLLPQDQRDELRAAKVPAADMLRMFSPDHIVLHAHDGSDCWHNIHPRLRPEHAEKSRRDTSIAAKTKRLSNDMAVHVRVRTFGDLVRTLDMAHARPKRKIPSRPFPPKGSRPMRSRASS